MLNFKPLTTAALLLGAVVITGTLALAQEGGATGPAPATADHHGMMGQGGGMMGMGMMSGVDPAQMNRMVENCNRMMESMMREQPSTRSAPNPQPAPNTKG